MDRNGTTEYEINALGTPWAYFCSEFDVHLDSFDMTDECVQKIFNQVEREFFSDRSTWRADFEVGLLDEAQFKIAFKSSIERAGLTNIFNTFLTRYADTADVELAFDVEPEMRLINLRKFVTREIVLLRRDLLPLEIHDYKEHEVPWMAWLEIAAKLLAEEEDLTHTEVMQFSAGTTLFKDHLLANKGASVELGGERIDVRKAISKFRSDYAIDTRIEDELTEVEFFLARFNLPKAYFTEIVDFFCKIEAFYRGDFRKSEKSKRSPAEEAPGFTHVLHVFRLAFGGLETVRHYPDFVPAKAALFWQQLKSPKRLLSLAFRIGGHDIPEDENEIQKRIDINNLLPTLQGFYVRCAGRLFPKESGAWVTAEVEALDRLNAKTERAVEKGNTKYKTCILDLLKQGNATDVYIKMCDNLHNMTTQVPSNYKNGLESPKFTQKIKDSEALIEKALEIGFYWFMSMNTLTKVFEANGKALLAHSQAWRTVYTQIYLSRGGRQVESVEA